MCSYSTATKPSEEGIATSRWIQKTQGKLQCQTCCLWHILSVLSAIYVLDSHLSFPTPPPPPGKKTAASKKTAHSPCKVIFKNVFPAPIPKMQIFKLHQTSLQLQYIAPKVWNCHKPKTKKLQQYGFQKKPPFFDTSGRPPTPRNDPISVRWQNFGIPCVQVSAPRRRPHGLRWDNHFLGVFSGFSFEVLTSMLCK